MSTIVFNVDIDILRKNVESQIDRLAVDKGNNKQKTHYLNLFSGFAAAGTTVLIGLSKYYERFGDEFQTFALVLSAALTVAIAWDNLFHHKELWLISARGYRKFLRLDEDIAHAEKTGSLTPELLKTFHARYNSILGEGDKAWDTLRAGR